MYDHSMYCGVSNFHCYYLSSQALSYLGARLLIRDLMCFVPVCSSSYLLVSLLLSAVIGTTLLRLACGIGISITLPLICGLPSVLDYLICSLGTWCV